MKGVFGRQSFLTRIHNNLSLTPAGTRAPTRGQGPVRTRRCICADAGSAGANCSNAVENMVNADFLQAYAGVCDFPGAKDEFSSKIECMNSLVIPPIFEQENILSVVQQIGEQVELVPSIQAALMDFLVHGNVDGFNSFLQTYMVHVQTQQEIQAILQTWPLVMKTMIEG